MVIDDDQIPLEKIVEVQRESLVFCVYAVNDNYDDNCFSDIHLPQGNMTFNSAVNDITNLTADVDGG